MTRVGREQRRGGVPVAAIPQGATVRRREDLLANDLSDSETVMLDMSAGTYFGVRDVGKVIWDRLSSPMTLDGLCESLVLEFDVDEPTCRRETRAFLEQLDERGLLEVVRS
jgi:hypothetical protein